MPKATLTQATTPSDEQIDRILDATADSFVWQLRSPILHAPSEQDLDYEDVSFPPLGLRDWALRGHLPVIRAPQSRRMSCDRKDLDRIVDHWKERA
jgi:hypothetical protein